ncbi:MAG TPA: hypothetical protein PLW77_05725 [Bacteroidales bacterium]|nr:hypothetical protein [Bacteroidales bacterium]HQB21399.1 hypothetical protein [Bacteroidales bacterium]
MTKKLSNIINEVSSTDNLPEIEIEAIYIPYYERIDNLKRLIKSLEWFTNPIYILPTVLPDNETLKSFRKNNLFINHSSDTISDFIYNLKTFKNQYGNQEIKGWDLPAKRNYSILHSITKGYSNILLIDDDIKIPSTKHIPTCSRGLYDNDIVGSVVDIFPDASLIDHISIQGGIRPYTPFLSGNFLFTKPFVTKGYFPFIYNEDWLYMVPTLLSRKLANFQSIQQESYNPFFKKNVAIFQEFGEIIAEGVFTLIEKGKFHASLFSKNFWDHFILKRINYLNNLKNNVDVIYLPFIKDAIAFANNVSPKICIDFLKDWQEDIYSFEKMKTSIIEQYV